MEHVADDDLLTTSAAAREATSSEGALRKAADEGRLPVQRTSTGLRLFRRGDVKKFRELAKQRRRV